MPDGAGAVGDDRCRALRDAGIPADRAQALVESDLVRPLGDRLAVVSPTEDPVAGPGLLVVPLRPEQLPADRSALDRLREWSASTPVVLRLPPGVTAPPALSPRPRLRYVRADPGWPRPAVPDGLAVHHDEPAHRAVVADLLARAVRTGYGDDADTAGDDAVRAVVDEVLDRPADELIVVTVTAPAADGTHEVAGHATLVLDEDELTGALRWELVDQFVLDPWRGTAVAAVLVGAAVHRAGERGLAVHGHVVGDGPDADRVLDRLLATGWRPADTYWLVGAEAP